ncbi:hypothetical protein BCV19_00565 [Vibrio splendidus]|uniref:Uncharacterized protein n=1 Tax=Vibrio splendidus TaxID=29497 RepID=A0A2N7CHA5_VIBSP|nr:hypothetical protein BCV19_00565 [Vibrio splendidus]
MLKALNQFTGLGMTKLVILTKKHTIRAALYLNLITQQSRSKRKIIKIINFTISERLFSLLMNTYTG